MNQCEVWLVDLNPTRGAEIQKIRPCIIVNDDGVGKLPLRVVIPITDWKNHFAPISWLIKLDPLPTNGLQKMSIADCFQIRPCLMTDLFAKLLQSLRLILSVSRKG